MNERDGDGERLRRLRLSELLWDLVRQEGKMAAAELLGVNHKTLTRAAESGEITGRMGDALELLLRRADDAAVARLRESVGTLEQRLAALEGGMETPPAADGEDEHEGSGAVVEDGGDDHAQEEDGEAGLISDRPAPPVKGLRGRNPFTERRLDPEIVTVAAAEDDAEVYGAAWPLVEEWRKLRAGHPHQGKSLSWLTTEERLLTRELAMLEEHGLTLPPETQPLRGFGRKGQINHRWKALADTRVALRKRKLLRWVRRVLTANLWRK